MWWVRVIAVTVFAVLLIVVTHLLINFITSVPPIPWVDEPTYRQLLDRYLYSIQPNPIVILLATVYMLAIVLIAVELISAVAEISREGGKAC